MSHHPRLPTASVGSLVNPGGGVCGADQDGAVAESNEANNTCAANTVSVVNAHLRLPLVTR